MMKNRGICWGVQLAVAAVVLATSIGWTAEVKFSRIPVADAGDVPFMLRESWNSMGMDDQGNVYAVFGGGNEDRSYEDCAMYQYNPDTGEVRLLGIMSEALKAADNYVEGEKMPKGHSQLPFINGKVYIGTQGFHDAKGALDGQQMKYSIGARGAHLFSYDPQTDELKALDADQPNGVFYPSAGFIALAPMPGTDLLVAQTVPYGELMFYNTLTNEVEWKVRGLPWEFGRYVAREIIPTKNGKVYKAYTLDDQNPPGNDGMGHMYVYDYNAKEHTSLEPVMVSRDLWNGQTRTRDGDEIYVVTQLGELARVHPDRPDEEALEILGSMFTDDDNSRTVEGEYELGPPARVFGLTLSADEKKLYAIITREKRIPGQEDDFEAYRQMVEEANRLREAARERGEEEPDITPVPPPTRRGGGRFAYALNEFDLETNTLRQAARIPDEISQGWVLGSNCRDDETGSLFFVAHSMREPADCAFFRVDFED